MLTLPCQSRVLRVVALLALAAPTRGHELGEIASPEECIQRVLPLSDRFETHVRVLEGSRIRAIRELLPSNLRYHEKGTRVVYSAYRGTSPLGFLHVRNEQGHWGVIQIAWHLNLDLTIRDFTFLRCREPERAALESQEFRSLLRTRGLQELSLLLDEKGQLQPGHMSLPGRAQQLASKLVTSAIKSLAATQVGWSLDLTRSAIRDLANRRFPGAARIRFEHAAISGAALVALERARLPVFDTRTRNSLLLARVTDENGEALASLVHVRLEVEGQIEPLLFTLSQEGIVAADSLAEAPRPQVLAHLSAIPDRSFEELSTSSSEVTRCAAAVLCIAGLMPEEMR
jgi:hypothetical protein